MCIEEWIVDIFSCNLSKHSRILSWDTVHERISVFACLHRAYSIDMEVFWHSGALQIGLLLLLLLWQNLAKTGFGFRQFTTFDCAKQTGFLKPSIQMVFWFEVYLFIFVKYLWLVASFSVICIQKLYS